MKLEIHTAGKAAIVLFGILSALATGAVGPVLPFIDQEFGTPENGVMIKMVLTMLGVGMLLGAPVGGYLADRLGLRVVMLWAAVACGLAGCAVIFSTTLYEVLLARFLIGVSLGAFGTSIVAAIGQAWEGNMRDRWLGLIVALGTLSLIVVSPATGLLADMGWRNAFLLYGLAFLLAVFVVLGFTRQEAGVKRNTTVQAAATGGLPVFRLAALGLVAGAISTGTALYTPFLFRKLGVDTATSLAFYSLAGAVTVGIAGIAYGPLRRKLTIAQVFIIAPTLCAIGLVTMALSGQAEMAAFGLALEGIGIGLLLPNLSVHAILKAHDGNRAQAVGILKGAVAGGPFLIQFALEPVSNFGGPELALLSLGTASGMMAVGMALMKVGTLVASKQVHQPEAAE